MEQTSNISVFHHLKNQDLREIETGNFNVLVINNFLDQIVNENIEQKMISQIYMICYLFSRVFEADETQKIHLCTEEYFNYNSIWKEGSLMLGFVDEFICGQSWEKMIFTDYDFIICHPLYEKEVLKHIEENYFDDFLNGVGFPKLFSLVDTSSTALSSDFIPYVTLLTDRLQPTFSKSKLEEISRFKKMITSDYTGFDLSKQEVSFHDLIKNISINNANNTKQSFRRILLIDDHKRSFYIGDSCFWLQNINVNIKKNFPEGDITVICRDQRKINFFNKIFKRSLDENLSFEYSKWEDVDFRDYDIILYDSDLSIRFLTYVREHYETKFEGTPILNYSNRNINETECFSELHYLFFFERRQPKADLISNIKAAKSNTEFEIRMQDEERRGADLWLRAEGVKEDEKIVVLIFNSSSPFKMLTPDMQLDLIKSTAQNMVAKVLLFDEKGIGLGDYLKSSLPAEVMDKVIVATQMGIRMDMALLSAPAIAAIISPCTGMMHLANGLFRYLKKNGFIARKDMPLMLVYTGNFMGFDIAYHPNIWWFNSLVKCAVLARTEQGVALVKLNKIPSGIPEYNEISMPLKDMCTEHLFEFLKKNYPELSATLFIKDFMDEKN